METKYDSKEDTGVSRLIKLCFNEIQAMKKLGLERKDILKHLKKTFGIDIAPGHFSTSFNRLKLEIKNENEEEAQFRSQKIAELVNSPELLEKNFSIYQYLTTPAVPIANRRNNEAPRDQNHPDLQKADETIPSLSKVILAETKQQTASTAPIFTQASDEVKAEISEVQKAIKSFIDGTFDGDDRRFLINLFSNPVELSRYQELKSHDRDVWRNSLLSEINKARSERNNH